MGTNYCLIMCVCPDAACLDVSKHLRSLQTSKRLYRLAGDQNVSMQSDWAVANRGKGMRNVAMGDSLRAAGSIFNQGHVLICDAALSVKSNPFP